ncbi:MAG: diphthine synthase, partial [Thermoplasmata archaeon]|nr:diphthine synthase [Thermoplasmata archaeon]
NLAAGLHTLVLMDIDGDRMLTAPEALGYLLEVDREKGAGAIDEDTLVAAVARAGASDQTAVAGPLSRVRDTDIGPPPHTVVVIAPLHFMEEESLRRFAIFTRDG